jgi:hypothetical protein
MKASELVPLQIPTGWIVHHNCFFNEVPFLEDGTENERHNDSEDLIWIEKLDFYELARYVVSISKFNNRLSKEELIWTQELWDEARERVGNISAHHFHIDLGWYGSRKEGHYRLVLHQGWDNIKISIESRSIPEIQDKINHLLLHPMN